MARVFSQKRSSTHVGNGEIYSLSTNKCVSEMIVQQNRMFCGCLAGRPYPWNTRENQMSPSCPDSSYSSHFAGCLLASYPRKHFSLQFALSLHTHSLSHTTLINKTHMKYRVHKLNKIIIKFGMELKPTKI